VVDSAGNQHVLRSRRIPLFPIQKYVPFSCCMVKSRRLPFSHRQKVKNNIA
jgi:hypothetical protein